MSVDETVEIHGTVAPGFEPVADAFARNFAEHGEVGAACAVRVAGEEVVDLWAGVADPATGRPYEGDTLQLCLSMDLAVPKAQRQTAQELIATINPRVWLGHFELWDEGEIIFRHGMAPEPDAPVREGWGRTTMMMRTEAVRATGPIYDPKSGGRGDMVDWIARAREMGFVLEMLPTVLALRRIIPGSMSFGRDDRDVGYLDVARRALARRRAPREPGEP